jgi:hypothetical protein
MDFEPHTKTAPEIAQSSKKELSGLKSALSDSEMRFMRVA